MVAKLFAKHIKLKYAIEFVKKTRMNFGVGTPSRLMDLFSAGNCPHHHVPFPNSVFSTLKKRSQAHHPMYPGALSFDKLERIVIDTSYIDLKKRGIFDMAETQKPLIQLLNNEDLKSRYKGNDNRVTLMLY